MRSTSSWAAYWASRLVSCSAAFVAFSRKLAAVPSFTAGGTCNPGSAGTVHRALTWSVCWERTAGPQCLQGQLRLGKIRGLSSTR